MAGAGKGYRKADQGAGIDALYINGRRISAGADKTAEALLTDYAGTQEKTVRIYAVDGAGNQSQIVEIDNPAYDRKGKGYEWCGQKRAPNGLRRVPGRSRNWKNMRRQSGAFDVLPVKPILKTAQLSEEFTALINKKKACYSEYRVAKKR